jgi:hypothetical protein
MKKSQKSLRDWTNQKWRTSDGSPSKGKKRYLPDAAWKALTPGEKAATNRAKAKSNEQFVKQPKNIAKKTAKYRAMGGLISNKFQNGGQLPKTPYNIRSTDILLPGAKEPSTVLMESGGYDNKEYAYPTLFPKDPTNPTNNPKDWMQLSGEAAFMEAQKRGELWEFPTAEEADSYARGSWKTKPQQKQNGGVLPKYETTLPLKEEANFMPWLESQYKAGNITPGDFDFYKKNNYGYNYDFRAAYKEGLKSSLNSKDNRQHWGDIGKKPNHPTFSNESKYHNVDGNIGGSWDGENFIPAQKQNGGTLPYVAPNLLEVEITPEGTELKDQPKELEAYYRDYAAQYPVTDKKDITKQYREGARNYAAEQLLKENPQGDRNRKDYLKSFTEQELAVLRNSKSKGKVNPTLMQKFEGALKQGAAAGAPGNLRYKKVETESLTDEEMKDVGALDLLGPLSIPAKLVQAGYKDGYSLLDALKGQENNASFIEDIATDPLNLVGLGLVSKGANAAKLLKAYKNLSKLNNTKRASTLQNAYKLNPFAFKPNPKFYYRGIGKEGAEDALESGVFRPKQNKKPNIKGGFNITKDFNKTQAGTYYSPNFKTADNYGEGYIAEVPKDAGNFTRRYKDKDWSQRTQDQIPIDQGRILKKDWLLGYKEVKVKEKIPTLSDNPSYVINPEPSSTEKLAKKSEPYLKSSRPLGSRQDKIIEGFAPGLRQERIERTTVNFNPDGSEISKSFKSEIDWAKWNKDIPNNKPLIKEYNAIEEATKADGTWMKNPDGSEFTGTPEQFVQQQSKNFKAAFKEGEWEKMYHGSKTDNLQSLNLKANRRQAYGEGLYMTDDLEEAQKYAGYFKKELPKDKTVYELAVNTKDAQKFNFNDKDFLAQWNRSDLQSKKDLLEQYRRTYGEEAPEWYLKSAEEFGNVGIKENVPDNMKDLSKNIILDGGYQNKWILGKSGIKSLKYNNGMFDMTNPNIYKAVAPIVGAGAAGTAMSQEKAMGGALDKSVMGYRDDSPYKNEPYLDINTPTGEIDMSETGVSLYANGKLLKPYSGKHKFNTSKVREVPVNNSWLDKYK